jgi:hypothetical protein
MMQATSSSHRLVDQSLQTLPVQDQRQLLHNIITAVAVLPSNENAVGNQGKASLMTNGEGQKSMFTNLHPIPRIHQYERRSSSLEFDDDAASPQSSSPTTKQSSTKIRSPLETSKELPSGQKQRRRIESKIDSNRDHSSILHDFNDDKEGNEEKWEDSPLSADKKKPEGGSSKRNRGHHRLFSKRMGILHSDQMDSPSNIPFSSVSTYEWNSNPSSTFADSRSNSHDSSDTSRDKNREEGPGSFFHEAEEQESKNDREYRDSWKDEPIDPKTASDFEYYYQTHQQRRRRITTTTTTTPAPYTWTPPPPPNPYTRNPNSYTTTTTPPSTPPDNKEIIAQVRLIKSGNPIVDQTVRRHGEISVKYHSEPVIVNVVPAAIPQYTTAQPPPPYTTTTPPPPIPRWYPTTTTTTTPAPYTPPPPETLWRHLVPQMMLVQYPTAPPSPPPPVYTTTTTTTPSPLPYFLDDYDNIPPPSKSPRVIYAIMMMDKTGRARLVKRKALTAASQAHPQTMNHDKSNQVK